VTLTLRKYTENDKQAVLDLHETIHGSPRSEELFDWKYHLSPLTENPNIIVAEHGSELVGCVGDFRVPLYVHNTPVVARQPVDLMIREKYRSAKLFVDIVDELRNSFEDDDVAVEFGQPTEETRKIWEQFENWKFSDYHRKFRLLQPDKLLSESGTSAPNVERVLQFASVPFRFTLILRDLIAPQGTTTEVVRNQEGFLNTAFQTPPTDHHPVCIQRDEQYWTWRTNDPLLDIRTYWIGEEASPDAAVLVARDTTSNTCTIALQECADKDAGLNSLSCLFQQILFDYRDAVMIEAPATTLQDLVGCDELMHDQWVATLSDRSIGNTIEEKFGISFDYLTSWTLGCNWYDKSGSSDGEHIPVSEWEFSPLLID